MAATQPQDFTKDSYPSLRKGTLVAAKRIASFLLGLFPHIRSMVDIGCGGGAWLHAFSSSGCAVLGYDFGIGVPDVLLVNRELYREHDLSTVLKVPRRFDLCISLEVAEHVKPEAADIL